MVIIISRCDASAIFAIICLTIVQLLKTKLPPVTNELIFHHITKTATESPQVIILHNNKTEDNHNEDVTNTTTVTTKLLKAATDDNNVNSSFSDDSSLFLEDDINFNIRGDCGMHKCFFRSKNKLDHRGYLIARETPSNNNKPTTSYKSLLWSYEHVQSLERKINSTKFRHFLTAKRPIQIENPSLSLINKLNSISYFRSYRSKSKNKYYYGNIEGTTKRIIIQEVIMAPEPALKLFCSMAQQHKTNIQLSDFISKIQIENNRTMSSFLQTFDTEWKFTIDKLLSNKSKKGGGGEPRLWYDFQILVDVKGHIYHIDLDRFIGIKKSKNKKYQQKQKLNCLPFVEWIKKSILLSNQKSSSSSSSQGGREI